MTLSDLARVGVPKCPTCGSAEMAVGGFVSFHWRRGRLVPKRGSEEIADGAPWGCNGCGRTWIGNYGPPFDFVSDHSANPFRPTPETDRLRGGEG